MRIWLPLSIYLLLVTAATLPAAETSLNGTTLLMFEQRSLPGFDKQNIVPATQFISMESTGVGDPNLSIHLNAWGRVDLADDSTDKSSDGTLSYGYLRYLFPKSDSTVKAGRIWVFEGVSSENLDGLYARIGLANGFALSAFGGAPVHPDNSVDNRGDYITGGRFSYTYPSILELGLSTVYENGLNSGPADDIRDSRQLVGADLWLKPHQRLDLRGRISYDTINNGVSDQSWLMALKIGSSSTLTADYNQYEFKEYFAASAIRSLFNPDAAGGQTISGVNFTHQLAKPLEVTASYRHYDRDETGNSDRYGAEGRLSFLDGKGTYGLSYFRLDAPSGINSYHQIRSYLLYSAANYSASIDGITDLYDDPINGKDSGFEIQGSAGYRFMPGLNLSCDVSYSENPAYNSEFKGLLRLTFNYTTGRGTAK